MKNFRYFVLATLWGNVLTVLGFITIDYVNHSMWELAVVLLFWTVLAVFILAPLYLILILIPAIRRGVGWRLLVLNILLTAVCFILTDNSRSVDILMSV